MASEYLEGRNPVLEAFRSGKTVDKLFVLDGCSDGPVRTILREAKKGDTLVQFVSKERLDQLSVIIGALLIATIDSAIPQLFMNATMMKEFFKGILILAAILLNVLMQRAANKRNLKGRDI